MKRKLLFSIIIYLYFTGCEQEGPDTVCGLVDPANQLNWLSKLITESEKDISGNIIRISHYRFEEENVFLAEQNPAIRDKLDLVFDCTGDIICQFGGIAGLNTCPEFDEDAEEVQAIWEYNR